MILLRKLHHRLQSILVRLVMTHIFVVTLTTILINLGSLLLVGVVLQSFQPEAYRELALQAYAAWQSGQVDAPNYPRADVFLNTPGFGLIVSPEKKILLARGQTACKTGMLLNDCAPELAGRPPGARFYHDADRHSVEVVINTRTGDKIIMRMATFRVLDMLTTSIPGMPESVSGVIPLILGSSLLTGVLSFPVALVVVWLTVRPLARRISRIATASQQFAGGDLAVRVRDVYHDEVGRLAQQFDSMADTLQQNVHVLRDLAQRNAALTDQAEQLAIQAERARLSRDLHDAIAQRLFSLTVSASTLPALIEENQQHGVEQARSVAAIAEQTLLDLRTLIVELRPAGIAQHGFANWLQNFCREWETTHRIPLELSMMLSGEHLSASTESTLYYITQEALSNVARHARATAVSVSVVEGRQQIILSVTDNGAGFPAAASTGQGKFGLMSMRERATAVGGQLAIESDTTRGCTIRVTLPLRQPETTMSENQHSSESTKIL